MKKRGWSRNKEENVVGVSLKEKQLLKLLEERIGKKICKRKRDHSKKGEGKCKEEGNEEREREKRKWDNWGKD